MAAVLYAHKDHTRDSFHRWQWTFQTQAAGMLVQLLGILITIALAQFWILMQSVWFVHVQNLPSEASDQTTMATTKRKPQSLWEFIMKTLHEALNELSPPIQLPGAPPQARWKVLLLKVGLVLVAFVIFIGILALGAVANALQGDSVVLITSPECGMYKQTQLDDYATSSLFETKAQRDAQQYARLCYGGRTLDYGCDQFSQRAIEYQTTFEDACPWPGGMCHLGANGSITFNTGPTPASALGINAKRSLQFERSTTCAPVNMNATFIAQTELMDDGCESDVFEYHYGRFADNFVRRTIKYRNEREVWPSYSISADVDEGMSQTKGFLPMPELVPPKGSLLTMMYIEPGRIFYLAPSNDPIFPATRSLKLSGMDVWQYEEGHARILGCVDHIRWRDRDGPDPKWYTYGEIPPEPPSSVVGSKWMLATALRLSTIYSTTSQVQALNASSLLYTYSSAPLYPKQWEIEARQMFEVSLARAQFEAAYMARGTYSRFPGWIKQSLDIVTPAICNHVYLANDPGFSNINGVIYLLVLVPCVSIIVCSCPWDDKLLWVWALGPDRAARWATWMIGSTATLLLLVGVVGQSIWKRCIWLGLEVSKRCAGLVSETWKSLRSAFNWFLGWIASRT